MSKKLNVFVSISKILLKKSSPISYKLDFFFKFTLFTKLTSRGTILSGEFGDLIDLLVNECYCAFRA